MSCLLNSLNTPACSSRSEVSTRYVVFRISDAKLEIVGGIVYEYKYKYVEQVRSTIVVLTRPDGCKATLTSSGGDPLEDLSCEKFDRKLKALAFAAALEPTTPEPTTFDKRGMQTEGYLVLKHSGMGLAKETVYSWATHRSLDGVALVRIDKNEFYERGIYHYELWLFTDKEAAQQHIDGNKQQTSINKINENECKKGSICKVFGAKIKVRQGHPRRGTTVPCRGRERTATIRRKGNGARINKGKTTPCRTVRG